MQIPTPPVNIPLLGYWLGIAAVAACAAAAVLEVGRKRFDAFGVVVVAFAAALGGGTTRDLLLGRQVFWIADPTYLIAAALAGIAAFGLARRMRLPLDLFLIPDAIGLALFTIVGTKVALNEGTHWTVAGLMGVITGVVGGILRDVLANEEPVVFHGELYATAAGAGALTLLGLLALDIDPRWAAFWAGSLIFAVRLAAIRWHLRLPEFQSLR
ncbi:trimeric intracellular cation channel family protein [Niveibacterium umoris]|uniref:Putative membrane protein YeiH n=1 Tax=Niveibacterium umoris TaxID=1193620 RepID=A0A840BL07_9RHOO|nr:TRIC cation channel family protein [Niveibacterium umoris]MBB4013935.1 putative membrane protein YeiH [Niveibacterium umoris]